MEANCGFCDKAFILSEISNLSEEILKYARELFDVKRSVRLIHTESLVIF